MAVFLYQAKEKSSKQTAHGRPAGKTSLRIEVVIGGGDGGVGGTDGHGKMNNGEQGADGPGAKVYSATN